MRYDAKKVFKRLYYEDFSVLLAKTLNLISLRIYKILLDYLRAITTISLS